jgi:predicted porin
LLLLGCGIEKGVVCGDALAAVAAVTAVSAQNVTLYGRVDANVGSSKSTLPGGKSVTQVSNGGLSGSRWGLRGTEDLGGGLKAVFVLENRFSIDTGATGAPQWGGDSYVGLTGGFGTVHLGRTYTSYDAAYALSNSSNVFDSAFTPTGQVFANGASYTSRTADTIKYVAPTFSGVTLSLSKGLKEDTAAGKKDVDSLSAIYRAGPLAVGYGYQAQGDATARNKFNLLSASYNLGVASVSGSYGTRKLTAGSKDTEYNIGVAVPQGAFTFSVGYANSETKSAAGAKTSEASGFGAGVTYAMSKRTTAYFGIRDTERKAGGVKANDGTNSTNAQFYAVGVRHNF